MDNIHEKEAFERWGNTDAFKQSQERTKRYTDDDWREIRHTGEGINAVFADQLREGSSPEDGLVQAEVELYHDYLEKYFYDCPPILFQSLALMYVNDERFRSHYEEIQPGLAEFISEAMLEWVDGGEPSNCGNCGSCGFCGT